MRIKRPGRRIIKTAIAVFISLLLSHYRPGGGTEFYSAIAAIICLKPDLSDSIHIGKNRILGTVVGGFAGFLYLLAVEGRPPDPVPNYIYLSLIIALLMWLMANLNKPDAISIMAIVFLSITINHNEGSSPAFAFALSRTLDTFIGVVMAIAVNGLDFAIQDRREQRRGPEGSVAAAPEASERAETQPGVGSPIAPGPTDPEPAATVPPERGNQDGN